MASAFEKRSGEFHAKFKDRYGAWRTVRTAERSLRAARDFAQEKERSERRIREGIETDQGEGAGKTFRWLAQWWLDTFAEKQRSESFAIYLRKYAIPRLGHEPLASIRDHHIEEFLGGLEDDADLAPKTLNDVRAALHRVFVLGRARGKWRGQNPVETVERRKVPKAPPRPVLRVHEVTPFLDAAGEWRCLMATALWMALRRGEIFALKKSHMNLADRTLVVAHSHEAETTKGSHADVLPIPQPLVPYLQEAIRASPSELVFPDEKGRMRSRDSDMKGVVRRILLKAGLVDHYELRCFRRSCRHVEESAEPADKRCPKCVRPLWAKAIARDLGFHGLRHTTATLLLKAKVPYAIVQKIMRHSDPRVTTMTYGHLDLDDMRTVMDDLAERTAPSIQAKPVRLVVSGPSGDAEFGANMCPKGDHASGIPTHPRAKSARHNSKNSGPSWIRTRDQSVMSRQL